MERFCPKCGSLFEGNGAFCPSCGERLESAVSLEKPDTMPSTSQSVQNSTTSSNTYGAQNSHAAQMPNYPQNYNTTSSAPADEMTVGQWVLTIFLSQLGLIGIILCFVWGFGSETNTAKKNFARAMLIWAAIAVGLTIILYIGMIACSVGFMGSIFDALENDYPYGYAMFR